MAQHRRTTRTTRTAARVAALGGITGLTLALTAGSATASPDDERCERADGVVVCLPADVDLSDLTINILTHEHDGDGFPPGYWDLGP